MDDNDDLDAPSAIGSDTDSVAPVEPVTGLVLEIAQHPKSDKMKVCQIDVATAGGIVQVVTTSLAVKEGMAVILAPAGCTMPGSGTRVGSTTIGGTPSAGMLCCAFDLGWAEENDGKPAYVPPGTPPGTPFPDDPYPEQEAVEHQARSKKDKGKKKKMKKSDIGFADLSDVEQEPAVGSEESAAGAPAPRRKAKGKKGKKAAAGFDDDVSDSEATQPVPEESDDDAALPTVKPTKGKGKKGKKAASSFADDMSNSEAAQHVLEDSDDGAVLPAVKSKKGKGKKGGKKAVISFAALADDNDSFVDPMAASDNEAQSDEDSPPQLSSKKKKKGKKTASSFADDTSDSAPGQRAADEDEFADESPPAATKPKKGKKSNKKAVPSFADLSEDDESLVQLAPEAVLDDAEEPLLDDEPPLQLSSKKKKKKGKKSAFVMPAESEEEEDFSPTAATAPEVSDATGSGGGAEADSEEEQVNFGAKKKKKKGSGKRADLDDAFNALNLDAEQPSETPESPSHSEPMMTGTKKKGKKKKTSKIDFDALEQDSPQAAPEEHPLEDEAATSAASAAPGLAREPAAARGKGAKSKENEDDIDALMAELDAPPKAPLEGSKKKKKKKAAAANKKAEEEEDLDALLSEFGAKPPPIAESAATAAAVTSGAADAAAAAQPVNSGGTDDAAEEAAGDEEDAGDGKEMSAAAKKKAKRKAKDKAKKELGTEDAPQKVAAGKAPKVNARVRAMQELQELRKREEDEARIAEEERARQEEETERAEAEAAAAKALADAARKEARAAHRAQLKKEGKLLTGKAKKEAERLAAMREQLLANTDIQLGNDEAQGPKKKVVYARKKSSKKPLDAAAAEAEARDAQLEVEQEEAKRKAEEEERKKADDAAKAAEDERLAREAAAAAAAAAAEAAEAEETSWEEADVSKIEAPAVRAQREQAEREEAQMRAEEAAAEEEANRREKEEAAAAAAAEAGAAREAEARLSRSAAAGEDDDEEEGEEDNGSEATASESASDSQSGGDVSSDESESEYSSSYDSETDEEEERDARIAAARAAREERIRVGRLNASETNLRSPICCILGHVDTGKTKILDNVRRTNVQDGEAGGITQQIGATYVPGDNIRSRTEDLRKGREFDLRVPGLLIIDTPGHESFTNLRSRGSSLCDIAILVIDLMHGLEPQTIESINLLKQRKTPFIIALNKVDRLFDWKATKDSPIQASFEQQKEHVQTEFRQRFDISKLNLNEQGLNVALYWENTDPRRFVNIVPTSAITGEGVPDLLQLLVKLTQSMMVERLKFVDELQATVLEVKVIEGLGTTMDVVLVNGLIREGAQIVVCGLGGPIVTTIRSLLTPHPMKELRVKGSYIHHKEIKAAQGLKIAANGLESAVAGTQLLVVGPGDKLEDLKEEVMADMADIFSSVDKGGEGVCVQASTLGSLEALLTFLKSDAVQIPVSGINIGPVHKKDVMRASVMLEKGAKKFAVILAFDVPVNREARDLAESMGIRIFTADIIYHLFDQFQSYLKHCKTNEKENARLDAVFPCILNIVPNGVFNSKDPIVLGVEVTEGICKVGTPLCVPSKGGVDLGRIASIENNKKAVDIAKRGQTVAIKIEAGNSSEAAKLVGRHFDETDALVSRITRKSINLVKEHFKEDLSKPDWMLMIKLKGVFDIQ